MNKTLAAGSAVSIAVLALLAACETDAAGNPVLHTTNVRMAPTVGCDFTPMLAAQQESKLALVPAVAGTMSEIPLNSVSMTDIAITNKILVQQLTARRSETGTVEVIGRLVNCTDFPLQVEGRTHFLDAGQAPVEKPTAWKRVFLPARAVSNYAERSTNAMDVQTYLIELREGQ